ncbi:hypothetical protein GGI26_005071 [Coemansia sp. RSA 1358]|nr:hypothetical protein GGI26_005071 [Coemansia sp. RSA 1358]
MGIFFKVQIYDFIATAMAIDTGSSTVAKFDQQPLFTKVGSDFIYQAGSSIPPSKRNNGFRTSVYKHSESSMHAVLVRIPRPVYTLNIYVPTAVTNSKGLPHALEHLVFCGSKRYPERGYLDELATCNLSPGSNAWTDNDNTCYTLSFASEEALANLLPVYLDHILNPLLRNEHFLTEVYHYDEDGKEKGVVFSELVANVNNPLVVGRFQLQQLMYNPGATYAHYFGGSLAGTANLTNKEVIEYHCKFYDVNNITVVMTGNFSDRFEKDVLQNLPKEIIQNTGCNSRFTMHCSPLPSMKEHFKIRTFPSSSCDSGFIIFGWHGPPHKDTELIIALEILFEYLSGTSSSPLYQRFIDIPTPKAAQLYGGVVPHVSTLLNLNFSGVPYSGHNDESLDSNLFDERYYEGLLIAELNRIHKTRFDDDKDALNSASKRHREKLAAKIESNPGNFLPEQLCSDIVASHFSPDPQNKFCIGSRARQFDVIDELSNRSIEYWLDLLKIWLIDQTIYHVSVIPDPELGDRLEAEREKIETINAAKIIDKKAHTNNIKQAAELSQARLSDSTKRSMPIPDPAGIGFLPHKHYLVTLSKTIGPVSAIQIVQVDSGFSEAQLHIPISDLPDELRAYLPLFKDLILGTSIILPAGLLYDTETEYLTENKHIKAMEVNSRLAGITTSYSGFIITGSKKLLSELLGDMFVLKFRTPYHKYALAVRWIIQAFVFADLTVERVLNIAQNKLGKILASKRKANKISDAVQTHFTDAASKGKPRSIESYLSYLAQEDILRHTIKQLKSDNKSSTIKKLYNIQKRLLEGAGGFLSILVPDGEDYQTYIDTFKWEWDACISKYSAHCSQLDAHRNSVIMPIFSFPQISSKKIYGLTKPLLVHIPVPSLQSATVTIFFETDLSSLPSNGCCVDEELATLPALDYYALEVLINILSRSDGPLSNAVRGMGYAYSVSMSISNWDGQIGVCVNNVSDITNAITAIKQVIDDMKNNWDSYVGDFDIGMAQSIILFSDTYMQSTPAVILQERISSLKYGFKDFKQFKSWRNTHIAAVTQSDIYRVYEKYLRIFLDRDYPTFTIVVSQQDTKLAEELGNFKRMTLEELSEPYKIDY